MCLLIEYTTTEAAKPAHNNIVVFRAYSIYMHSVGPYNLYTLNSITRFLIVLMT